MPECDVDFRHAGFRDRWYVGRYKPALLGGDTEDFKFPILDMRKRL